MAHELRLMLLAAVIARRWRWTALFPFLATAVAVVVVFVLPVRYTSEASFYAQAGSDNSLQGGIAGIAGELGLQVGAGPASPQFWADLVKSRTISDRILEHRVNLPGTPRVREFLGTGGSNRADSLYWARRRLDKRVKTDVTLETGVVSISVTASNPRAAFEIVNFYLAELDTFNLTRRESQARAQRVFIEGRIRDTERDLRASEDDLQRFYEANKEFRASPALTAQEQRLIARVSLFRDVVLTLRHEYENARIQEVDNTPVLTLVEQPAIPARKSFPRRIVLVVASALASVLLGFFGALGREALIGDKSADGEDLDVFKASILAAREDFKNAVERVLPPLRRVLGRS